MVAHQEEVSSSVTSTATNSRAMRDEERDRDWLREMKSDERGLYLIELLARCAGSVAAGAVEQANAFLERITLLTDPDGDAMQRITSYFSQALALRLLRHWPGLYRALHPPLPSDDAAARRHLLDLCPLLSLAFLASNYAILEAMEGEKLVHVVDLSGASADAARWVALLHALSCRPEGPPHLRITMVNENKHLVEQSSARLTQEAERLDVPFQFNGVVSRLDALDVESLGTKSGEAVAISSVLELHSLLSFDDTDKKANCNCYGNSKRKLDSFLASLWGLSPKVMVITEQEANHNGLTLMERFTESLNYYAAVFDCLESTAAGSSVERARVERVIFGEEIKNIIACEGTERRERHEKAERWAERMEGAGFARVGMSMSMSMANCYMQQQWRNIGYKLVFAGNCFFLCWQDRPLYSVSAWTVKPLSPYY